jgi:hypothetical protein
LVIWLYTVAIYAPVCILYAIFVSAYGFYLSFYVYPLVGTESDRPKEYFWEGEEQHERARVRGWLLFSLITLCLLMLVVASIRAMRTSPGSVPDAPEWHLV